MDKTTFFLPIRKGSQRVKNKNTREFANYSGGLVEIKLSQLIKSEIVDEILISTNCEESIDIAQRFKSLDSRIKIDKRPDYLCLDSTPLTELINYAAEIVEMDHICWGHVTTPLVSATLYDEAILSYYKTLKIGNYDSLVSVLELKNFFLDSQARLINGNHKGKWPRTQDLDPVYEMNHAMFINSKDNYIKYNDRLGIKPYMYKMNKMQSFDVDWMEDFLIAEQLYAYMYGKH